MSLSRHAIIAGNLYIHRSHKTGDVVRRVVEVTDEPKPRVLWHKVDPKTGRAMAGEGDTLLESFANWADDEYTILTTVVV